MLPNDQQESPAAPGVLSWCIVAAGLVMAISGLVGCCLRCAQCAAGN